MVGIFIGKYRCLVCGNKTKTITSFFCGYLCNRAYNKQIHLDRMRLVSELEKLDEQFEKVYGRKFGEKRYLKYNPFINQTSLAKSKEIDRGGLKAPTPLYSNEQNNDEELRDL